MSDNPTVSQQYAFSVGEDGDTDGIEPSEESVETDAKPSAHRSITASATPGLTSPKPAVSESTTAPQSPAATVASSARSLPTLTTINRPLRANTPRASVFSRATTKATTTPTPSSPRATKPRERSPTAAKQSPKPTRNVLVRRAKASITDLTDSFMTPQTSHGQTTTRFAASVSLRLHQTT